MEKPVGFLKLEMGGFFKDENSVCTGFCRV